MTSTLPPRVPARDRVPGRPSSRTSSRATVPVDAVLAGLPAALWAAVAGLVLLAGPVLLAWVLDARSGSTAGEALRTVGQGWVYAHGAALQVPGGSLGLVPLGLTAVVLALLARAGRHTAQVHPVPRLVDAARLTAAVAVPYALLVAAVSAAATTAAVRPAPVQALLGGLVLGGAGAGVGVLRGSGQARAAWARLPERLRRVTPPAAAALLLLLGAGALLAAGALALRLPQAAELSTAVAPGPVAGLGLAVLGLALVPTAVVWSCAWLVGPGFALGSGTTVGPFATELGPTPALPLLAGLPSGAPPLWAALLVLAVPLGVGALAGLLVQRRGGSWLDAALTGPLVGAGLGLLCLLAAGPVGGGRLAQVGPAAWAVALCATALVATGAVALVLARQRWAARTP